ncbi:MAG: prepilin-type N-terminal cleavage/methylation domain-containing protein [Candidatus Marinimicrobia bacterium]|nr:prepilin-type N-terminal cleavage/methylation domain-containing protein [Candidatus Neomarinimicrobiota bacterium]
MKSQINYRSYQGFTLIELVMIIIILSILSAIAVPKVTNIIEVSRDKATRGEMTELKKAIMGDPAAIAGGTLIDKGFNGDIGHLPDPFTQLITQGTLPDWNRYTQTGWNGPYMSEDGSDEWKKDAWDNDYIVHSYTAGDTSLVSHGPDGAFGGGDDLILHLK